MARSTLRASFEFALVSVAAVLRVEDGMIVDARLAAGGVGPLPWRLNCSEAALVGRAPGAEAIAAAGDLAISDAQPLAHNGYKIELLRNAVIRALQTVGVSLEHQFRLAIRGRAKGHRQRRI